MSENLKDEAGHGDRMEEFAKWAVESNVEGAKELEQKVHPPAPVLRGRKLSELVRPGEDDPNELLRNRYLCRGGGLLLVGPTGIGKSSLSMQCMMLWALGREAFGIKPARPLKSLLIQAENDEGDLAEMRDGVRQGLHLTLEEAEQACANIIVVREDTRSGEAFFSDTVKPLLEENRPDLLWIDPALAYLGGEANSQKDVGAFLRNQLNPLLHQFECGCVVVHHTNKPLAGQEKSNWQAGDFAYLGSGSAEWANWARAVVAMRSTGSHSIFELRAGKRGTRIGWREEDGETKCYAKFIAHADEPGVICWREVAKEDMPAEASSSPKNEVDLMAHVPVDKPITKAELLLKAGQAGIGENKTRGFITVLLDKGRLYQWKEKRPGTNPVIKLARFPQPPPQLALN